MKRILSLSLTLVSIFFCIQSAYALPASYLDSAWVDLDKYWAFDDLFTYNFYYESNSIAGWQPGEIWTNHDVGLSLAELESDPNWIKKIDNSCWMASAASMLSNELDIVAREIYDEMLDWATLDPTFYWTKTGFTHVALEKYLEVHGLTDQYTVKKYSQYSFAGNLGWLNNSYDFAKGQLFNDRNVGLGIYSADPNWGHALTFWGWNETSLIVADSDRDPWSVTGYESALENNKWYLNYSVTNDPNNWYNEVGYMAILVPVPEPETFIMFAFGGAMVAVFYRRRGTKLL